MKPTAQEKTTVKFHCTWSNSVLFFQKTNHEGAQGAASDRRASLYQTAKRALNHRTAFNQVFHVFPAVISPMQERTFRTLPR